MNYSPLYDVVTSLPVLAEPSLGLLLILSLISSSTQSSCCCCCCCSFSVLQGVPDCRGEEDDMGRLGLGVPEAVLAGARKMAFVRPHCSPAKLTETAFEKPLGAAFRTPFWTQLRISLGIPRSWMYICGFGLLLGESSPELELELGLWLAGAGRQGVRGSIRLPGWQRGAGVRQLWGSWKGRRRCSKAGFVPETGRPRLRRCCRNSDTWRKRKHFSLTSISLEL